MVVKFKFAMKIKMGKRPWKQLEGEKRSLAQPSGQRDILWLMKLKWTLKACSMVSISQYRINHLKVRHSHVHVMFS